MSTSESVIARNRHAERRQWTRVVMVISAAAIVLLLGYADLWRGGQTISALLLTFGYLIMVPVAIVVLPPQKSALHQ